MYCFCQIKLRFVQLGIITRDMSEAWECGLRVVLFWSEDFYLVLFILKPYCLVSSFHCGTLRYCQVFRLVLAIRPYQLRFFENHCWWKRVRKLSKAGGNQYCQTFPTCSGILSGVRNWLGTNYNSLFSVECWTTHLGFPSVFKRLPRRRLYLSSMF